MVSLPVWVISTLGLYAIESISYSFISISRSRAFTGQRMLSLEVTDTVFSGIGTNTYTFMSSKSDVVVM